MKTLVIGSGGREHALAWKLAQDSNVDVVYVAPGNAGTAQEASAENLPIGVGELKALAEFARQRYRPDLIGLSTAGRGRRPV